MTDSFVSPARRWWTFAIVSLALFMGMLDNLVVTTALPAIQRAIGAGVASLEWVVNAYTLAFAVLMIPATALGERFGKKRVFLFGVGLFTFGSVIAAVSTTSETLILGRLVQGVGSAMIAPLSLTILVSVFPKAKRPAAIGLWSGVSGLGLAMGPLIGGAIVNGLDWSAVFWVNVPLGVLLLFMGSIKLEANKGKSERVDIAGILLAGVGLFGIVFGLIRGNSLGWGNAQIVVSISAGAAVLVVFLILEARKKTAGMIDLRLFRARPFSVANAVGFASSFAMFGSIFFITLFVQGVWGWNPLDAGLGTMPWTGTIMLTAPFAGALAGRFGARRLVVLGMIAQATSLIWIGTQATHDSSYLSLLPPFIIGGFGMGLSFAPLSATVMSVEGDTRKSQASGIYNTVRELGGVFGIAVLGAVFQHTAPTQAQFVDGFHATLQVAGVLAAAAALLSFLIPGTKPLTAAATATPVMGEN